MGKRGPTKKPLELKILDGTYREDHDGCLHKQPRPEPVGHAEPPSGLGEVGLAFWHDHYEMLRKLGLLTPPDLHLFGQLCRAVEELDKCDRYLAEHGYFYENARGGVTRHPMALQRRDYVAEVHKLASRFGMTPGDRSGMQVDRPADEKKPIFRPLGG